jgi:hypothetical protein
MPAEQFKNVIAKALGAVFELFRCKVFARFSKKALHFKKNRIPILF